MKRNRLLQMRALLGVMFVVVASGEVYAVQDPHYQWVGGIVIASLVISLVVQLVGWGGLLVVLGLRSAGDVDKS
jgi:hypothetical protein